MDHLNMEKLIHLDLKGAPPNLTFLEKFLPFIKSFGCTGILLEWEDTFPYTKELTMIGSLSPYSVNEASKLLQLANENDLKIIPLVQTFGHMEFILKHDDWKELQEVNDYPSSLCPSKNESLPLIRSLVDQIVNFHSGLEYIHIGGDEVWHLGLCAACTEKCQNNKYGKSSLYLDHITEIALYIKSTYPSLKIIIWDDMFRKIDEHILEEYSIGKLLEPMIWHYGTSDAFFDDSNLWDKYTNIFPSIWAASAFKGATGSCQIIPTIKYHVDNQECWIRGLDRHREKIQKFKGVALTGWSRYDHYATLCELMPCGIPSLCLCLRIWFEGRFTQEIHGSVGKILGYKNNSPISNSTIRDIPSAETFSFPGWQVFVAMEWLVHFKNKYRNAINSDHIQTWCNSWQISNNYTNPMQIDSILPILKGLIDESMRLEESLNQNLGQIFYQNTIEEIIGTNLVPIKEHLIKLERDCALQRSKGCSTKPKTF